MILLRILEIALVLFCLGIAAELGRGAEAFHRNDDQDTDRRDR